MNKAILIGHLGGDPELKYTADGTPVCNFSLATSERYKDKSGEKKDVTEWHRIVVWRKQAEIAGEYLKKGSHISLEGAIKTRNYEDKDGVKRYVTEIVMDRFEFLGGDSKDAGGQKGDKGKNAPAQDDNEELPF